MVNAMDSRKIVYDRFISPFNGKQIGNIGTELEFPLINKSGGDIDTEFVASLMDYAEKKGFSCVLRGVNGEKLFTENAHNDTLSFDNSYNNFEFSMMYGDNLCKIKDRFDSYFDFVEEYLEKGNHSLCGRGTNPHFSQIKVHHAPFSTYNMVSEYLHNYKSKHSFADFPAYISSVQTHLDTDAATLPFAYTLFCRLDFVRGLLFSNSPDFANSGIKIFRDFLWENSAFGSSPNITGTVDRSFESIDDIIDFFLEKGLFNRIRNGKYETFEPVKIKDYFKGSSHGAKEEDIECYLSFCNVEITSRGTLEVRSDCTQKEGRFFMPPAFNLGILNNLAQAEKILDEFFKKNNINEKNSVLRKLVASGNERKIASDRVLSSLCQNMLSVASDGLKKRGKGEERLLSDI